MVNFKSPVIWDQKGLDFFLPIEKGMPISVNPIIEIDKLDISLSWLCKSKYQGVRK